MKYIRTKDGLWKYNQKNNSAERPNKEFKCNQIWLNIKEKDILKQADTIKELCDSEVIVWKDSTPSTWNEFLTKQEFEHLYSSFQRKKVIAIYGAIWTDKGLKYVAKMNEKGELELL